MSVHDHCMLLLYLLLFYCFIVSQQKEFRQAYNDMGLSKTQVTE